MQTRGYIRALSRNQISAVKGITAKGIYANMNE
jgi:hypothetical protein